MLNIARRQIVEGLRDAKFLFLAAVVMLAFLSNAIVFSDSYKAKMEDYKLHQLETHRLLQAACDNLQTLAIFIQKFVQPPSPLEFIAEGGSSTMPNTVEMNTFARWSVEYQQRTNDHLPALPAFDWVFIVGMLMTLLAILVSYAAVAGEKQDGTLRLVLSNQVSKLQLFAGKAIGLLIVLLICLLVGVTLNLVTMQLLGGPPIDADTIQPISWAVALSALAVSAFVLLGMAVSSMARHPAISLVILLVIWVLAVFAVPGIARLISEQTVEVKSQAAVRDEISAKMEELQAGSPREAGNWNGNPFDPHIPSRAKLWLDQLAARMQIFDDWNASKMRQVQVSNALASVTPYGMLMDGLQKTCTSGVYGFMQLNRNAIQYRRQLYQFTVNMDKTDNETPHLVYGSYSYCDPGVFSQKPVAFSSVPKAASLWTSSGLPLEREWPVPQLLVMFGFNLLAGLAALIALLRYDPR